VRTEAPLVLDVHELLESPGVQRTIAFTAPVPDITSGLVSVRGDVDFDLTLEAIDGGVLVRGVLVGEMTAECRRCLEPMADRFRVEGAELYRPPTDVWEEGYAIKDLTVDLEPMARDTIAVGVPRDPLCRPECAGLCSRCGKNLNEGPCDCPEEVDARWSALKELGQGVRGRPPTNGLN
jgi:uncharacterized protein